MSAEVRISETQSRLLERMRAGARLFQDAKTGRLRLLGATGENTIDPRTVQALIDAKLVAPAPAQGLDYQLLAD